MGLLQAINPPVHQIYSIIDAVTIYIRGDCSMATFFTAIFVVFILVFIIIPIIIIVLAFKFLANHKNVFNMDQNHSFSNNQGFTNSQSDCDVQQEQQRLFEEQQRLFQQQQNDEQNRQFMQHGMDESIKSVTPFEMGGYDMNQGNSFNDPNMF